MTRNALQRLAWYAYNKSPVRAIRAAYGKGEDLDEEYILGKVQIIRERGFLYWAGGLDAESLGRLAADVDTCYPTGTGHPEAK